MALQPPQNTPIEPKAISDYWDSRYNLNPYEIRSLSAFMCLKSSCENTCDPGSLDHCCCIFPSRVQEKNPCFAVLFNCFTCPVIAPLSYLGCFFHLICCDAICDRRYYFAPVSDLNIPVVPCC